MNNIILNILCAICGICAGISIGLGFFNIYQQPKNIKRQISFGIITLIMMGIIVFLIYKKLI